MDTKTTKDAIRAFNPLKPLVNIMAADARDVAKRNNITGANNENAIEHTHVSAEIGYRIGDVAAEIFGDFKELLPGGSDPGDIIKDQYNNEVGRRIADWLRQNNLPESLIDDLVVDAFNNDELIIDPDPAKEPRVRNQSPPSWNSPSESWCQQNNIACNNWYPDDLVSPLFPGTPAIPPWIPLIRDLFQSATQLTSPLVLDLGQPGIEVTALENNAAYFDLSADGFATSTGWITGDDGFLAIDRNANGQIDDITELFGNAQTNGFTELAALDTNSNGVIEAGDTAFANLLVWRDANENGITDEGELAPLSTYGITAINLDASAVPAAEQLVEGGNLITDISTYTKADGTQADIIDVWFKDDPIDSYTTADYEPDLDVLNLPLLKGYGKIPDMLVAASQDSELRTLLEEFAALTPQDYAQFDSRIEEILYHWAGVDEVSPDSRGQFVDARQLEFMEALFAQDFAQSTLGNSPNPGALPGRVLGDLFDTIKQEFGKRLLVQGIYEDVFDFPVYDVITDSFYIDETRLQEALETLGTIAPAEATEKRAFYLAAAPLLFEFQDIVESPTFESTLDDLLEGTNLTIEELQAPSQNYIFGDAEANTLTGTSNADFLDGREGNDTMIGSHGGDTYLFDIGSGTDIIDETGNYTDTDIIQFGGDIAPEDVTASITGNDLTLTLASGDSLISQDQYKGTINSNGVEEIHFLDGTIWHPDQIQRDALTGTETDDHIVGFDSDDSITGGKGNDTVEGGNGSDTYNYALGDGSDTVIEDGTPFDTDTFLFTDLNQEDIHWQQVGDDLQASIVGTSDIITFQDQLRETSLTGTNAIEEFHFADGSVITNDDLTGSL